ncbi:MAG: RNA methyltransferase [Pirellulales bacterium]|nr:RNA methyltransferase [Pirellulales bacterium]
MFRITSVQNPRVKEAARLRDRRQREKQRRIIIDGARELIRAIGAGVRPVEVFVCRPLCQGEEARRVLEILPQTGTELMEVTEAVFEKVAFGNRGEGVVAVAETPAADLEGIVLPGNPLAAVLEGVEKPGNVGAVLRSADGAGVSAVIVADAQSDLYNPNAIRASLGTIFTMPVAEATAADTLAWLRRQGLRIFTARVDGAVPYTEADFRGPAAIVLGSESRGLTDVWRAPGVTALRLPMRGAADSLNVSATAAVLFYEALRQRGW